MPPFILFFFLLWAILGLIMHHDLTHVGSRLRLNMGLRRRAAAVVLGGPCVWITNLVILLMCPLDAIWTRFDRWLGA